MQLIRSALVLSCFMLSPTWALAQNTLVTLDFQDTTPFTQVNHDTTTADADVFSGNGACGGANFWNLTRVASGGWNNRGYVSYTWCDWDVSSAGYNSGQAGWFAAASGQYTPTGGWQSTDTYYVRFRIYFETGIIPHSTAPGDVHHQFKFVMLHSGVLDGDHRAMIFFTSGDYNPVGTHGGGCNGDRTTQVCVSIQRNINHTTEAAYFLVPVGAWAHLQFGYKHGAPGTSFVKAYNNNNTVGSPTAEDLTLDTWSFDAQGYQNGYSVGNAANQGTAVDGGSFVYRLMDFQFGLAFDASWYPAGDVTNPVVTITGPTSDPTYATGTATITIVGTCTDNVAPTSVTWAGAGSGTASGTTSWSFNATLVSGSNAITVTCADAAANQGTDLITVTYTPAAPSVALPGVLPRRVGTGANLWLGLPALGVAWAARRRKLGKAA